jgi:hypothetical protein
MQEKITFKPQLHHSPRLANVVLKEGVKPYCGGVRDYAINHILSWHKVYSRLVDVMRLCM